MIVGYYDKIQPIQEVRSGKKGKELVGKIYSELKKIGSIKPPREFVLMDRAAVGLGSVFMRLGSEINWHRLFHNLIDDFDELKVKKLQNNIFKKYELSKNLIEN